MIILFSLKCGFVVRWWGDDYHGVEPKVETNKKNHNVDIEGLVAYGAVVARNRRVSRYGLPKVSDEGVQRHGVLNGDERETKIVEQGERDGREI